MMSMHQQSESISPAPISTATLQVHFATFNYWWNRGDRTVAANALSDLLDNFPDDNRTAPGTFAALLGAGSPVPSLNRSATSDSLLNNSRGTFDLTSFRVQCLLKKAEWIRELGNRPMQEVLMTVREARELAPEDYSVWHSWAVANYNQLQKADSTNIDVFKSQQRPSGEYGNFTTGPGMINQMRGSGTEKGGNSLQLPPLPMTSPSIGGKQLSGKGGVPGAKSPLTQGVRRTTVALANLLTYKQETETGGSYVIEAIKGFVRSIVLGRNQPIAMVLQDTLRLLTLWFTYGTKMQVFQLLSTELEQVSPEHWLMVLPQLIARMHVKSNEIAGLLQKMLVKMARTHPQALVCPIYVALNTTDLQQKQMATEVVAEMRKGNSQLVDEAILVSRELLQVAITPHEAWHDGLESAAQQYLESKDTNAMVLTLMELHDTLNGDPATGLSEAGSVDSLSAYSIAGVSDNSTVTGTSISSHTAGATLREVSFKHSYGRQLADAQNWLIKFKESGRTTHLHQAWELYQVIFKRIKAQISGLKKVELHHVSPALTAAANLSLAIPGTYVPFKETVSIAKFSPSVTVIASKQRPRRMVMIGSDGKDYKFLLKGHEDLRQDERVMQLFGLINVCFDNSQTTKGRGMDIVRYSVLPLSNNSGVIGWVDNCDTLNSLVKQYREMKQIRLTLETKLLANKSQNYNKLTLMQKVEAFTQVLDETTGQDLSKMMWLKSRTSDAWVERRAYFTKSLAVMSMVGYILGLGDRHPSNLMVDRVSGRIVHIDFGDCFEVTAKRPKFPEIIPFRLTRMLQTAVGRSGIEGTFRVACERVCVIKSYYKSCLLM
jgi:FKBP12-rapamycin complex-associated protein